MGHYRARVLHVKLPFLCSGSQLSVHLNWIHTHIDACIRQMSKIYWFMIVVQDTWPQWPFLVIMDTNRKAKDARLEKLQDLQRKYEKGRSRLVFPYNLILQTVRLHVLS